MPTVAGERTVRTKKVHIVGYLMVLLLDLCIPKVDNVSINPGFEGCDGCFDSDRDRKKLLENRIVFGSRRTLCTRNIFCAPATAKMANILKLAIFKPR